MANKTVIEGSDNVKASQLKEFFRQIDEKMIKGSSLQSFLEGGTKILSFTESLFLYLKDADREKRFKALRFQKIAEGMIITYDDKDEYDIYFDTNIWEHKDPEVWGKSKYPKLIYYKPLGLQPTAGNLSIKSFEGAHALAGRIFKQKVLSLDHPSKIYPVEL